MLALMLSTGGCCLPEIIRSTYQPYETLKLRERLKRQAKRQARQDWNNHHAACYANHACGKEIRSGFETAYVETALGMKGCPPPIPTTPLISRHTIAHTYPAAVPWYQGYNIGHASAVAHGVDRWRIAPLNPEIQIVACESKQCKSVGSYQHAHSAAETLPEQTIEQREIEPDVEPIPAPMPLQEPAESDDDLPSYLQLDLSDT